MTNPVGRPGGRSIRSLMPRWLAIVAALSAMTMMDGAYEIAYGARVPDLQTVLAVGSATMGLAGGLFGLGLMLGSLWTTVYISRRGTKRYLYAGNVLTFAPMLVIGAMLELEVPTTAMIVALLALWGLSGFGLGMLTPAFMAQATDYSRGTDALQHIMSWKLIGTALGAFLGGLAIANGIEVRHHFMLIGGIALLVGVVSALLLPELRSVPVEEETGEDVGLVGLVVLALLITAAVIPLALAINWATTVLAEVQADADAARRTVKADAWAASGQIGFALAQASVMLAYFWISKRWSPRRTLRLVWWGVAVGAIGAASLLWVAVDLSRPHLPNAVVVGLAVLGFTFLGGGIAPLPGLVHNAASRVRAGRFHRTTRLGVVISIQYPLQGGAIAIVGWIGESTSVTLVLAIVGLVCVLSLPFGRKYLRHAASDARRREVAPQVAAAASWLAMRLQAVQVTGATPGTSTPRRLPQTWEEIAGYESETLLAEALDHYYVMFGGWLNITLPQALVAVRHDGVWVQLGNVVPSCIWTPDGHPKPPHCFMRYAR